MIHIRFCRNPECQAAFDMGEGELCPKCRGEAKERSKEEVRK